MSTLKTLAVSLREYFPEPNPKNSWIRNPFTSTSDIEELNLTEAEQDQLIDLSSNGMLKNVYKDEKLLEFWLIVQRDHKEFSESVETFNTILYNHTCEQAFSTLCYMKIYNIEIASMFMMISV